MPQIRRWWQSSSPNAGETVRPPESGCGGSEKDESARKMAKPLAIDLFCGLGGWTEGLLAEGYDVVGFDIERHVYGEHRYPAQHGVTIRAITRYLVAYEMAKGMVMDPASYRWKVEGDRSRARAASLTESAIDKRHAVNSWGVINASFSMPQRHRGFAHP